MRQKLHAVPDDVFTPEPQTLKPNVPDMKDIQEVVIRVPVHRGKPDQDHYENTLRYSREVHVRVLTPSQITAMAKMRNGLRAMNFEESKGNPVDGNAGAMRWLLEQIAIQIAMDK